MSVSKEEVESIFVTAELFTVEKSCTKQFEALHRELQAVPLTHLTTERIEAFSESDRGAFGHFLGKRELDKFCDATFEKISDNDSLADDEKINTMREFLSAMSKVDVMGFIVALEAVEHIKELTLEQKQKLVEDTVYSSPLDGVFLVRLAEAMMQEGVRMCDEGESSRGLAFMRDSDSLVPKWFSARLGSDSYTRIMKYLEPRIAGLSASGSMSREYEELARSVLEKIREQPGVQTTRLPAASTVSATSPSHAARH